MSLASLVLTMLCTLWSSTSSAFARVGISRWRRTGLLLMKNNISTAVRRLVGSSLYSPPFQSGSPRIASITIRRQTRLRPEICAGRLARGMRASMKSGYRSPQTQVCMPPIDVPRTRRRWFTPSPSASSRYWAATMSAQPTEGDGPFTATGAAWGKMVHAEPLGQESVLGVHHVGIPVRGKPRVQAVARLARFPVPDPVRDDDVGAGGVERLPGPEK